LRMRLHKSEQRVADVEDVCRSCSGLAFGEVVKCDSRDCPVFYTRIRDDAALRSLEDRLEPVMEDLENGVPDECFA
jgi:DNA polymerase zeta